MRQENCAQKVPLADNNGGSRHQQLKQNDEQQVGRGSKRRSSCHDQYDELIGAIDQGTSSTRFLVFEKGTGRLVASSQLEIKRITPREGWVEMDPNAIMSSVYATMANVHDQLLAKRHQLNLEPSEAACRAPLAHQKCQMLLKCIGICNQRESAVVWDSKTGQPLYNVIVWMDNRTKDIVDNMIDSIPGRDFNHLKDKTGLPMSTYFSAFKLRWLIDNVPEVRAAMAERRLLVGTVDSWILWNLTGKHLTDVTNASRTFLMDIETLQWDKALCKQFRVPMEVLPKILSSADDFGALQFGPFMGTPVTGVIGDQSAALFGHNCLQLGQTKATFGTGCFIMQNIGPGPLNGALSGVQREAKRGLITTVGYKLKDKPVCYALEGSIKIAGAALTWLRDNMQLIDNYEQCDQLVNTTTNSAGVFFVPALGGLYSPYWDPNAAGLFIGLSQFTRREHLVRATFDSIAFQTNDILSLMRGVTNGLMIDGGLCKSDNLCQILADITGCDIVRPSMCETSALGAAMVAGCGAGIWNYDSMMAHSNTPHQYSSSSHQNHHYPHESLNYDENKFAHSARYQAKCFKQTTNYEHHNQQQQHLGGGNSTKRPDSQEIQHQQQPTKHRRSLRHRSGGRLMRNLDAGGGINDDAGGGEDGGGGGGDPDSCGGLAGACEKAAAEDAQQLPIYSSDDDDETGENDNESNGNSAARGHVIDSASERQSRGDNEPTSTAVIANPNHRDLNPTSDLKAPHSISSCGKQVKTRALTNLIDSLSLYQGAPSSSGYSSGDNLESGSITCQLTDSMRLSDGRIDSPNSQETAGDALTASGRESVATFNADNMLNRGPGAKQAHSLTSGSTRSSLDFAAHEDKQVPAFPFHLSNFMGEQHAQGAQAAGLMDSNDSDRTVTRMVARVVQQTNKRNFVSEAEDVADEVHEFGGRDSYGEDGYDSSTVSSYDDYADVGAFNRDQVTSPQNDIETYDYVSLNGIAELGQRDEINSSRPAQAADEPSNQAAASHHNQHKRRQQASLLEKQMDVYQSYISLEHRTELVDTWRSAVARSMQWTKVHHEEVRRIDYQRLSSLPISMYVFLSVGLVALSSCMSPLSLLSQ